MKMTIFARLVPQWRNAAFWAAVLHPDDFRVMRGPDGELYLYEIWP